MIGLASLLYLSVGIFGYIYARSHTDGNILNNFRISDPLAVLGRLALACCIIGGLPLIVLPSRELLGKLLVELCPNMFTPNRRRSYSSSHSPISAEDILRRSNSFANDPHAEAVRQLAANRSFHDSIDAHDPIEPVVDSDSETDELIHFGNPPELLSININGVSMPPESFQPATALSPPLSSSSSSSATLITPRTHEKANSSFNEFSSLLDGTETIVGAKTYSALVDSPNIDTSLNDSSLIQSTPPVEWSDTALFVQTLLICFSALFFSVHIRSVATLWNLVGSSTSILVSFIIPSGCYIKIRRKKPLGLRMLAAWGLLIAGSVTFILCTFESFATLSALATAPKVVTPPATPTMAT